MAIYYEITRVGLRREHISEHNTLIRGQHSLTSTPKNSTNLRKIKHVTYAHRRIMSITRAKCCQFCDGAKN